MGRPKVSKEFKLTSTPISLTKAHIKAAKVAGAGNKSLGVRLLIDIALGKKIRPEDYKC